MRFLLDMPISSRTAVWLRKAGHDVLHARDVGLARANDTEILARAQREERVVLTMDLDFPRLMAASGGRSPGVILIRLIHPNLWAIQQHLESLFRSIPESDLTHAITVLEETQVRLHRLPIQ